MPSTATPRQHPDFGTELVRDWAPDAPPRAHIVLVHGLAEHCGRYERTGSLLAGAGFHVRGFDLAGAGASGGRRWHVDDWEIYHTQVEHHLRWARDQGGPVVLMGHSMGGAIALGYLLGDRPQPDLAILSAPALAGGPDWQKPIVRFLAKLAPKMTIPNPFPADALSRDPEVVRRYQEDPLVVPKSTLGLFAALTDEMDDLNARLSELDVPTLVTHGGEDKLVPTRSSEPLGELDCVDRRVYEGLKHETLNEPEGPEVVADIVAWIDAHL